MPATDLLRDLLVVFACSALAITVFARLGLPPLVGYLLTGVLIGPSALGLVAAEAEVRAMAEVGVMLLLFTIGLQFSIDDLVRLRRTVTVGGTVQVVVTIVIVAPLARWVGAPWPWAIFLGMLVAHSSSTLILRLFSDRGELDALHARSTLGISLFQDVSIVPMVLLLPLLTGEEVGVAPALLNLAGAVAFVAVALVVARMVVPSLLQRVVATRQREAFLLAVLVLCVGAAWAASAAGLSLALGAFVAGLVVSESEYSHHALGELLPLREVFIALFFVSVGMLLDLGHVAAHAPRVALALTAVLVVKAVVATGAVLLVGHTLRTALLAGVALAQVGEFAFVLAAEGARAGLLDESWRQLVLATSVGSMMVMPFLLTGVPRLAALLERGGPARRRRAAAPGAWSEASTTTRRSSAAGEAEGVRDAGGGAAASPGGHVIVVGCGLNGRTLARVLSTHRVPFVIVEMNPEVVRAERVNGHRLVYGDASRPEVLRAAGIDTARVLVVAISDASATRRVVALAHRSWPAVHVVARTRYVEELAPLHALGADQVIPEEFETAIEIVTHVLAAVGVPVADVARSVSEVRSGGYAMLRATGRERLRHVERPPPTALER